MVRDLLNRGNAKKHWGLARSRYRALLVKYTHFLVFLYYLIMILILAKMILILPWLVENDSHSHLGF